VGGVHRLPRPSMHRHSSRQRRPLSTLQALAVTHCNTAVNGRLGRQAERHVARSLLPAVVAIATDETRGRRHGGRALSRVDGIAQHHGMRGMAIALAPLTAVPNMPEALARRQGVPIVPRRLWRDRRARQPVVSPCRHRFQRRSSALGRSALNAARQPPTCPAPGLPMPVCACEHCGFYSRIFMAADREDATMAAYPRFAPRAQSLCVGSRKVARP
jgi:hypothetical protein